MGNNKDTMIAKYGSLKAYKAHMSKIASRPRKSSSGGFSDRKFASLMGQRGGRISRRKK